jgi:hypothetical protein
MSDRKPTQPKKTLITVFRVLIGIAIFLAVTIAINWR